MQAVILSAGQGTRLMPLTNNIPKVMLNINGKPLLEYHINLLKQYNITEIFINLFTFPEVIVNYFSAGEKFGVRISYGRENTKSSYRGPMLLGSAGALINFQDKLKNDFFILYGDVFMQVNLQKMLDYHQLKKSLFTIATHEATHPADSDLVETDNHGRVTKWLRTPHGRTEGFNSAGLYIMNTKILKYLPSKAPCDFAHDFIPILLINKIPLYVYQTQELLMDIGTIDRYYNLLSTLRNE